MYFWIFVALSIAITTFATLYGYCVVRGDSITETIPYLFLFNLFAFAATALFIFTPISVYYAENKTINRPEKYPLVSLRDTEQKEGSITGGVFLLIGGISGSMTERLTLRYSYKEDGYIKMALAKVKKDNFRIKEIENGNPKVIKRKKIRVKTIPKQWKFPGEKVRTVIHTWIDGYDFVVPSGTVKKMYKIDLK